MNTPLPKDALSNNKNDTAEKENNSSSPIFIKVIKAVVAAIFFFIIAGGVIIFIKARRDKALKERESQKESAIVLPKSILLTDGAGVNDGGFNANAWEGILKYYGDFGKTDTWKMRNYDTISCSNEKQQEEVLTQNSSGKVDLIIATGFDFLESLEKVAPKYPNQKYVLVDTICGAPNVMSFVFTEEQGSYLVGAAAALKAKADGIPNPSFGFVGGESGFTITKFEMGYLQGIHQILPNATARIWYSGDWDAPMAAASKAREWYGSGVYAIFSAAGNTGLGVISEAAKERESGKEVWSIGVDTDQYKYGVYGSNNSSVLTSMQKCVDNAVTYALRAVENGTFRGEVITMSMKEDGVGYTKTNSALTAPIIKELDEYADKIKNHDIEVVSTYKDALQKGLINFEFPHCRYDK